MKNRRPPECYLVIHSKLTQVSIGQRDAESLLSAH